MKKLYTTIAFALMAMTSMAQEQNDTTYVMFDFNLNPWNYPVTTAMTKYALPDSEDETGAIFKDTEFAWPVQGTDKNVVITVYAADLDEFQKPAVYAYCEENNDGSTAVTHPKYNMLFTYPGTTMRFCAPEGYKFGKMVFYFYKASYFLLDTEEEIEVERDGVVHKDKMKIWIPTTPKVNQNNLDCWEGDETIILFNSVAYFKGNFMKIDMRLVPDGSAGIHLSTLNSQPSARNIYDLQGRKVKTTQKGIYVTNGKKVIR